MDTRLEKCRSNSKNRVKQIINSISKYTFLSRSRFREVADIPRSLQLIFEVNMILFKSIEYSSFQLFLESWRSRIKTWCIIKNLISSLNYNRMNGIFVVICVWFIVSYLWYILFLFRNYIHDKKSDYYFLLLYFIYQCINFV